MVAWVPRRVDADFDAEAPRPFAPLVVYKAL